MLRAHLFTYHLNVLRSSAFCSQVHPGDVVAALFVPETTCEPRVLRSELARAFSSWTHDVHPYLRLLTTCRPSIGWKVSEKRLSLGLRTVNGPCLHSPDMLCARALHLQTPEIFADYADDRFLLRLNGDGQSLSFRYFWGCQQSRGLSRWLDGSGLRSSTAQGHHQCS